MSYEWSAYGYRRTLGRTAYSSVWISTIFPGIRGGAEATGVRSCCSAVSMTPAIWWALWALMSAGKQTVDQEQIAVLTYVAR